ncbi:MULTISPECIES: alpha/beta hydrolase [unclassified Beijerinckia]|uniref:alpha/beta fold hydrolase n=1 Tax=unclassified Beijerinckia TaxID=2638183 RepID=UPI001AEC8312|nr:MULTISPECIES: alpha/beta hydrolase [unclassified Beijerinckia]MDH7797595.1 pimeloyl-ACP methyl ester carboxylesterase [Beijerinckia sp. GAS462]
MLHQTPRSWDEYRDVLPLLGRSFRVTAMDTPGFGASQSLPPGQVSIENWARAALSLLDELGIVEAAVVGHHTGAAIALEIAAAAPQRVSALVLSACPFVDATRREKHGNAQVIDDVDIRADGAHLAELWRRRQPFYPIGDTALLSRFMIDALRAGPLAAEGHRAVNRYVMEARIGAVRCPTLVLAPCLDPHAYPAASRVAQAITGSVLRDVEGAMVPFPDQMPETFASLVRDFIGQQRRAAV